ncbi:hypothetical protein [Vulcanisaeta thermophila]|nr:hypothetical protein [Vulcanisaeta thermophila]
MPGIMDLVQEEVKRIVGKYMEQVNDRVGKARDELMRKIEELKRVSVT